MKVFSQKDWLLLVLFIVGFFGYGFQAVPIFTFIHLPIALAYARHGSIYNIAAIFVVNVFTFYFAYLGNFHDTESTPLVTNSFLVFELSFLISILITACIWADRYVVDKTTCIWKRVLTFPALWTTSWYLICDFSILGDYANASISLTQWPDLFQISSLGGEHFVTLLVALFATSLLEIPSLPVQFLARKPTFRMSSIYAAIEDIELDESSSNKYLMSFLRHPFIVIMVLFISTLIYGGAHNNIRAGSFYQVGYPNYIPKVATVGCVVGVTPETPELQMDYDHWLAKTEKLAQSDVKLITWAEITVFLNGTHTEDIVIKRAQEIAKKYKVYLNLAYGMINPDANKQVFIDKYGTVGINYHKAHPVPGMELQPAGEPILQYMDTEDFGRVGTAICFDFNFRSFIKQASKHEVDLMIQSSYTWGPIGTHLGQANQIRAIENGFTLLRCASEGLSGVFEPNANGIFTQKVGTLNDESYVFNLPLQKRFNTIYGYIGDLFVYICAFYGLHSVGTLAYAHYKQRRVVE